MKQNKKVVMKMAYAFVLGALLLASSASANLVGNSGFEFGLTGWATTGTPSIVADNGPSAAGSQAVQLAFNQALWQGNISVGSIAYSLKFDYKIDKIDPEKDNGIFVLIQQFGASGWLGNQLYFTRASAANTWYTFTQNFTPVAGTQTVTVVFEDVYPGQIDPTAVVKIDNVEMLIASSANVNMVGNRGFESGLTGWATAGTPSIVTDNGPSAAGTKAAQLSFGQGIWQGGVAVGANPFFVSFDHKVSKVDPSKDNGIYLILQFWTANGQFIDSPMYFSRNSVANQWYTFSQTITPPPGTATTTVYFNDSYEGQMDPTAVVTIDNVSVVRPLVNNNLILWYKCDDAPATAGLKDYSGNELNAAFWGTCTNTGTSVKLTEAGYVFSPLTPWNSTDSWTWSLWVYGDFSDPDLTGALMNRVQGGHHQMDLYPGSQYLVKTPTNIQHQSAVTANPWSCQSVAYLGNWLLEDSKWHHVAVTYDQPTDTMKMYFDGSLKETGTVNADGQLASGVEDYLFSWGLGSGGWLTGELKDIRVYRAALTDQQIQQIVFSFPGDINNDSYVDSKDLAYIANQWLTDTTSSPQIVTPVERGDFEAYVVPPSTPNLTGYWSENTFGLTKTSNSTVTLLTNPADAHGGSKAMRWVYNTNDTSGNAYYFTEMLYTMDTAVDMSGYDKINVWIKRHSGNNNSRLIFLRVYNGTAPAAQSYLYDYEGSSWANPDEWWLWSIDLNKDMDWWFDGYSSKADITQFKGIVIGVSEHDRNPAQPGTGTIDVDDFVLVRDKTCSIVKESDLNGDCLTNFIDFAILAKNWLESPI